jgi:hypothetical protein
VLPKSPASQAVAYALKNWTALTHYCDDPDLAIDNNHTERSLRGFAAWAATPGRSLEATAAGERPRYYAAFVSSCEL